MGKEDYSGLKALQIDKAAESMGDFPIERKNRDNKTGI